MDNSSGSVSGRVERKERHCRVIWERRSKSRNAKTRNQPAERNTPVGNLRNKILLKGINASAHQFGVDDEKV